MNVGLGKIPDNYCINETNTICKQNKIINVNMDS